MLGADRDVDLGAGAADGLLAVEHEADLTVQDLKGLVDVAVDVLGGDSGAAGATVSSTAMPASGFSSSPAMMRPRSPVTGFS